MCECFFAVQSVKNPLRNLHAVDFFNWQNWRISTKTPLIFPTSRYLTKALNLNFTCCVPISHCLVTGSAKTRIVAARTTTPSRFTETVFVRVPHLKKCPTVLKVFSQSKQSWTISVAEEHFFARRKKRFSLVCISLSLIFVVFFKSLSVR